MSAAARRPRRRRDDNIGRAASDLVIAVLRDPILKIVLLAVIVHGFAWLGETFLYRFPEPFTWALGAYDLFSVACAAAIMLRRTYSELMG